MLVGTAVAIAGLPQKATADNELEASQFADPAVAVWRQWQDAHHLTDQLCHEQQRLEQKLIETVGFPRATIRLHDGESVTLHSIEAIHGVLDLGSEGQAASEKAEADLAAHQARWDAADEEIGYSAALRAEVEAAERAEDLLELLSKTPATSLTGVAAKLDAVLREGEISGERDEFPWPQIRSAFEDVDRIGQRVAPPQLFPDGIRQPKILTGSSAFKRKA